MNHPEPFPKSRTPWFAIFFWLVVAVLCLMAQLLTGCSSTIITTNGCVDDAGSEITCASSVDPFGAGGSTSSTASSSSPTGAAGSVSVSSVGGTGSLSGSTAAVPVGGSGPDAASCDLSTYVNWSCGDATGPAATAAALLNRPADATPVERWTCLPATPVATPASSVFAQMQISCAYVSFSHVCFHC
jgi:hypothetical protein